MSKWTPRRIECAGGCGLWWYQARVGRPRRWCGRCYRKHKSLVNHGVAQPALPFGVRPWSERKPTAQGTA